MLRDAGVELDGAWAGGGGGGATRRPSAGRARGVGSTGKQHEEIDRELRRIAKSKSGLEVEEARWLREAERHRIWRKLGYSTALEYLEDVFGYAPRTAKDRLRVAKELGELPELEAELRDGALPYSAARELTRVMTRANQQPWLARARGKNMRDIQLLVAGHKKGDTPDDPKDPALMTRPFVFELDARRQALLQQVRGIVEAERGEYVDDADLLEAMCMSMLRGVAADQVRVAADGTDTASADMPHDKQSAPTNEANQKAPRPAHQIVIRRCEDCSRAWQQGRGMFVPITKPDLELAACDSELVREEDILAAQTAGKRRPAPTLSIPKKTRDRVMARDQGRCRFPGCRATRHVAIHHIVHRILGGGHDEWNLIVLCDGHHKLLHDGLVTITGRAPDQLVFMRGGKILVDARAPDEQEAAATLRADTATTKARSRFGDVVKLEEATQALKRLGFKVRAAKQALKQARAHVGTGADVPTLVRTVLALNGTEPVDARAPELIVLAKQALVQSGFAPAVAEKAVANARAHVGTDIELAAFLKEALRHCRWPPADSSTTEPDHKPRRRIVAAQSTRPARASRDDDPRDPPGRTVHRTTLALSAARDLYRACATSGVPTPGRPARAQRIRSRDGS